jgi:hypothetical protein
MNLATSAAMWPTPQTDSFRSRGGARKHEKGLDGMARDWPTPMATDGNKPSSGNRKSADLTSASQMWMTPTARDHKDGATTLANTPVNGLLGRQMGWMPPFLGGNAMCHIRGAWFHERKRRHPWKKISSSGSILQSTAFSCTGHRWTGPFCSARSSADHSFTVSCPSSHVAPLSWRPAAGRISGHASWGAWAMMRG